MPQKKKRKKKRTKTREKREGFQVRRTGHPRGLSITPVEKRLAGGGNPRQPERKEKKRKRAVGKSSETDLSNKHSKRK